MGPFDNWPTGSGFEHFYGFIGGETNQYAPAIYRDTVPIEPDKTRRGGLSLHRGHDRPGHRLDPPAEGADGRQAVLRLLRAGRHARAPSRPDRVVRQVQGPVRRGLGPAARGDLRPPEDARGHPGRCRADRPPGRDPGLGRHARRPQAGPRPADGGLRRASSSTPTTTSAGCSTRSTTWASPRTRWSTTSSATTAPRPRARPTGCFNELVVAERGRRPRDDRVHGLQDRQVRDARGLQPLRRRLGPRHGHALPVDQAGRLALGRHPQRHDRALARRDQGQGRDPHPVPPRHRRRADHPRGRRAARSRSSSTASSRSRSRASRWPTRSTTPAADDRHTTQYFEMFCNRGIYHEGWTAVTRHIDAVGRDGHAAPSTTTSGSCTARTTGRRPTTCRRSSRTSSRDLQRPVHHRGRQVQRPAPRRPPLRALQPRHGRATAAGPGQHPAPVRRHGPPVRELDRRHEEQVATRSPPRSTSRTGGADGVIVAQGGAFGGWTLYVQGWPARRTATTCSGSSSSRSYGDDADPGRRRTRSAWSSPTTAAASARAARCRCSSTATKVGDGRVDATVPMLFSADETTDVGQRHRDAGERRLSSRETARSPAPSTGSRSTSTRPPRTSTT